MGGRKDPTFHAADGWRVYRVRFPKNDQDRSMALSPWSEQTVEFRVGEERLEDAEGQRWRFRKIDSIESGERLVWTYDLDPETGWLDHLEKSFYHAHGQRFAHVEYDLQNSAWEYPEDLCHVFSIPAIFQNANLRLRSQDSFHLLVAEDSVPWRIRYKVEEIERISTPAGRFDAFRIVLHPDYKQILGRWGWAWRVIHPFVPDFHFWVDREPPHRWIRFKGHLGPVGASCQQVYELAGIEEE